jgi:hypothetical protein
MLQVVRAERVTALRSSHVASEPALGENTLIIEVGVKVREVGHGIT